MLQVNHTNDESNYEMVSREQSLSMRDHGTHDSRVVLYAPVTGKLFGKYDMNYTVMVCMCVCVCLCVCECVCECVFVCVFVCV